MDETRKDRAVVFIAGAAIVFICLWVKTDLYCALIFIGALLIALAFNE